MANTIQPDELGKDENQDQPGQPNNSVQAGQAPSNPSQAPAVTSNQVSNANPNQQKGSGFTNIQKVIGANQGNQLGQAVGSNIQQAGNQAQDNLKNAQNQFQQQSQANQFNTEGNKQLVQNVLDNPTQYNTQDQTNPNSQQGRQFQTLISGQYQGPQNLANANQIQAQGGNLAQMGQALGSSGGRQALLQQMFGNPQYTSGQQTLDNLLLGQSQSPALQAAKRQALMGQGQINNAVQGAAAQGQQAVNEAQNFGQGVQGQFANTVTGQNKSLQDAATKAQGDRDAQYQQTLQDLKTGNITQQEADQLGLSQGQNVYNLLNDPSKFVSESALQANASNIASPEDYAKIQALQNLGGQYVQGNQDVNSAFANYQDPTQAGKFAADKGIIGDQGGFKTALDKTQSDYNSIYQPAYQKLQDAQSINRLASGQVTQDEIDSVVNNPQLAQQLQLATGGDKRVYNQVIGNMLLQQKYPAAAGGGVLPGANNAWASGNLQSSQTGFNNAQQQLLDAYGNPLTINIGQGTSYPSLTGLGPQQRPG